MIVAWGAVWSSSGVAGESPAKSTNDLSDIVQWSLLAEGGAEGCVGKGGDSKLTEEKPDSICFTVKNPGQRCGMITSSNFNVTVHSGQWYDVTFEAGSEARENGRGYGLTFSLEDPERGRVCARTTLPEVGGEWARYSVALYAHHSDPGARMTITLSEPGTIWLNDVTVSLRQTKTP